MRVNLLQGKKENKKDRQIIKSFPVKATVKRWKR